MPAAALTDDEFARCTELLSLQGTPWAREFFLSANSNGLVFVYGPATKPKSTDAGTPIAASASAGFGPATTKEARWDLRLLWVRNLTAGSNSTVALNGTLEPN